MRARHIALLAFSQILWGANFAVVKWGLADWPPLFFAGDGLSSMNGWQEGAVESAQQAVRQLHRFHAASA